MIKELNFDPDMEPEKKETWLSKIQKWWEENIYEAYIEETLYFFRKIKLGIKNLIEWFPIIWEDRHWDDKYIFDILQHKIKLQSRYIRERDFHTLAKRDSEIMDTCVRLIEKVKNEDYQSEYFDYHDFEWKFVPLEDRPGYSSLETEEKWENFDDYFKRYPLVYKRVLNGEGVFSLDTEDDQRKTRIAMNIAHINHERARKLLFKILESQIERWWN